MKFFFLIGKQVQEMALYMFFLGLQTKNLKKNFQLIMMPWKMVKIHRNML